MTRRLSGVDVAALVAWLDRLWMASAAVALLSGALAALASAADLSVSSPLVTLALAAGVLSAPPAVAVWLVRRTAGGLDHENP